ncbi:thioredoxin family protein [Mesobacillus thioparans]|uniref:thioredoxin family protein n=1 Tax=Mesobacillus thioparans TaxID=370439 RepID=UPI0039EFF495
MIIKVLGTDCEEARGLENNINRAIQEAGVAAFVEMIQDCKEIERYSVNRTPAVVIDEKVVSSGKQLSVEEIMRLF